MPDATPEVSGQSAALAALLEGATQADAATRAKVSERTVNRWMQDPDFKRSLHQSKQQAMQAAVAQVHGSLKGSVDNLLTLQSDKDAPAGARVRSVKVLFDIARQSEDADLDLRLDEAEAALRQAAATLEERYKITDGKLFDLS